MLYFEINRKFDSMLIYLTSFLMKVNMNSIFDIFELFSIPASQHISYTPALFFIKSHSHSLESIFFSSINFVITSLFSADYF
jgi:hypothetical protein